MWFKPFVFLVVTFGLAVGATAIAAQRPEPDQSQGKELTWVTPEVKAPRVSFQKFESSAAKASVSYHIYLPAAYEQDRAQRFPVVYWLHGSGGGLPGIPRVAAHFDEAIESGKTPPCLIVFVNGMPNGMYVDWKDGSAPLETVFVKELVPLIDSTYRTIATREGRMLDGYSMGGYGSARLGFKYPELFRAISIMGGGPLQPELNQTPRAGKKRAEEVLNRVYGGDQQYFISVSPRRFANENAETIAKGSLVRQVCGDQDETFQNNLEFHQHLEQLKIPHTWQVLKGVDHNPMKTLEALGDENWEFYRKAFGKSEGSEEAEKSEPKAKAAAKSEFELTFKVGNQERRALVVNAPVDGSKRPTVLALHGGQGSAEVMRANSRFDPVAKANGVMVVYPEGTDFGQGRHAWNTGYLLRRQVRDADDIAYLDTLIDKLIAEHGADPARIYMTGGSNGGMMTYVYAVARPERLAAVAPVVASMFSFEKKPSVPLPILIINGAKDEEVPLEGGMSRNPLVSRAQDAPYKPVEEVVKFWVEVNQSRSEPEVTTEGTVTKKSYAATRSGAATEFIVDSAGGHGWPGTRNRRGGQGPIMAFNGAEQVWEFFRDKQRKSR